MPSKKDYGDDFSDREIDYIEEDTFSVDLDDDGNPCINPDLHSLGMERRDWVQSAEKDIEYLFNCLIEYRDNSSESFILENLTFNRFLLFVANNSLRRA